MRYWSTLRALAAGAFAATIIAGVAVAVAPTSGAGAAHEPASTLSDAAPLPVIEAPLAQPAAVGEPPEPEVIEPGVVAPEPVPAPPTVEQHVAAEVVDLPDRAMQCESGVEVAPDGSQTSSAVVERVPADTPLAPGCHWLD